MGQVHLAFLWHLHQPFYLDAPTKRLWMPWVRLHGVKDYTGMALLMEEFPGIRATVNFSPCLLDQIESYAAGAEDTVLATCRKRPDELSEDERRFLRHQLFLAHPDTHIRAIPRFEELQRQEQREAAWNDQDYLDLVVAANLAWIHPLVRERDPEIEALVRKGRGFTTAERDRLLARHLDLLAGVLPRWRALQDRGQAEICVSPYYHPILPLLCDFSSLHDAMPGAPLPSLGRTLAGDAGIHVARAREKGRQVFGRAPEGCWPSEGSVSPAACELLSKQGFRWAATDEEILARSTGPGFDRDASLYRPHRVGDLALVFRDQVLSNLVSFTYKTLPPEQAADDFMGRLAAIGSGGDRLVVVALDGENPWEHYPGNAVDFLRALYRRLSASRDVKTVTMSEGIGRVESGRIDRLFSGSWINHNFSVWAGHDEDRRAWEQLGRVRSLLAGRPEAPAAAWESLYAAEGSDWYWWFGEDYSTPQDAEFDALFRRHLSNACTAAGILPPAELAAPIKRRRRHDLYRLPWAALRVQVDGRRSDYFEWIAAGHYDLSREFGAMAGQAPWLSDLLFGYDDANLLVRLDFRSGVDPRELMGKAAIKLIQVAPLHRDIVLWRDGAATGSALAEIFEAAVPFKELGVGPGDEVSFYLGIERQASEPVRVPALTPLSVPVPSEATERIDWQV